eukprot:GGOE01022850.1.p1 GENE.GGOE01022850.1~~GGOE01022850.1.p1  ORF type:complete len:567 (+),score=130.17 GGOE01022850.1:144-1703(+)
MRNDAYARLFDASKYQHWGVIKRLRTLRFHKYYVGIVKQYAAFFDFDSTDFAGIYDLTDCHVSSIQNREFAIHGARLIETLLFRTETDPEAETWHAQFLRAAHYKEDRAHERRLVERRRRLEQRRQQRLARAAEQGEGNAGDLIEAFDYEGRMAQLLAEKRAEVASSNFISIHADHVAPACPKCRRSYGETQLMPLVLPCHHTFCTNCLRGMVHDVTIMECHTCEKQSKLPAEGVTSLPQNYALRDLVVEDVHMLRRLSKRDALDTVGALCPVCFDPFSDSLTPMLLACGHSVCDGCVTLMAKAAKPHSIIKCPECRIKTELAGNGVSINFALKATLDEILRLKNMPDDEDDAKSSGTVPKRSRSAPHASGKSALRDFGEPLDHESDDDELLSRVCTTFQEDVAAGRIRSPAVPAPAHGGGRGVDPGLPVQSPPPAERMGYAVRTPAPLTTSPGSSYAPKPAGSVPAYAPLYEDRVAASSSTQGRRPSEGVNGSRSIPVSPRMGSDRFPDGRGWAGSQH